MEENRNIVRVYGIENPLNINDEVFLHFTSEHGDIDFTSTRNNFHIEILNGKGDCVLSLQSGEHASIPMNHQKEFFIKLKKDMRYCKILVQLSSIKGNGNITTEKLQEILIEPRKSIE